MEDEGGEISSVVCPDVGGAVGRVGQGGVEEPWVIGRRGGE